MASRPDPGPRTIHAMMPITDSSVSEELDVRGSGPARLIAMGVINSRGLLPFTWPPRLIGTAKFTNRSTCLCR